MPWSIRFNGKADTVSDAVTMLHVLLRGAQVAKDGSGSLGDLARRQRPDLITKASNRSQTCKASTRLNGLHRCGGRKGLAGSVGHGLVGIISPDPAGRQRRVDVWQPGRDRPIEYFNPLPAFEPIFDLL